MDLDDPDEPGPHTDPRPAPEPELAEPPTSDPPRPPAVASRTGRRLLDGLGDLYDPDDEPDSLTIELPWPPLPGHVYERAPALGNPPGAPGWPGDSRSRQERPASQTGRPPPGLLDLTISWAALNGDSAAPARLGRIGPITVPQALPLAAVAALDPHAQWRVILTDPDGHALAVERVRRRTRRGSPDGRAHGTERPPGVVGRVTVIVPAAVLDEVLSGVPGGADGSGTETGGADGGGTSGTETGEADGGGTSGTETGEAGGGGTRHGRADASARYGCIRRAVLRAAVRAATRSAAARAADADAPGGCAHTMASASYRPPTRIREFVAARDQTCRQPTCRQPAWRADLDHTQPWHLGGLTCPCNLGGFCRTHHQIKQLPGWHVTQPRPGHFHLTTPAGRTYETHPDTYPS